MEKSEKQIEFELRRKEIEKRKRQLELEEEELNIEILQECKKTIQKSRGIWGEFDESNN